MALTSFCGLLTLQVGAAILAAVFFAIAGASLAANIFDYHSETVSFPYSLILLIFFVVGMIIAGTLMFGSSYLESRSISIMSVIIIVILICYWLILCAFSFLSNPDHVRGVCINTRCPESFWIANLGYRRQHIKDKDGEEGKQDDKKKPADDKDEKKKWVNKRTDPPPRRRMIPILKTFFENTPWFEDQDIKGKDIENLNQTTKYSENINYIHVPVKVKRQQKSTQGHKEEVKKDRIVNFIRNKTRKKRSENKGTKEERWQDGIILKSAEGDQERTTKKTNKKEDTKKEEGDEDDKPSRYVFGSALIGAIILFIINFIFLLFSAFVMYSWAQELTWADYYYHDDDSVVVVEDY